MSGETAPGTRLPGTRLPGTIVLAMAMPLVLASCSLVGDEDAPAEADAADKPAQQVSAPNGLAPLTGRPATSKAAARRPALAVAIRADAAGAGSAAGLSAADFVYQEVGSGRVVALFQTKHPPRVGPLAQARPFDAKMLPAAGAVVATAGGPSKFVRQLAKAKGLISRTPASFAAGFRSGYAIPRALTRGKAARARKPVRLLQYAAPGQPLAPGATPASKLTVELPGADETWAYDTGAKLWRRSSGPGSSSSSGAGGGSGPRSRSPGFAAANVVVQLAPFKTSRIRQSGQSVRSVRPYGKGTVTAVAAGASGGQSAAGTWRKSATNELTLYGSGRAKPLLFTPGPTWVIIAPVGTRIRTE
jgi:hypothetical protein